MVLKSNAGIRLSISLSLIFFCFLSGCTEKARQQDSPVTILWGDSVPSGLIVSRQFLPSIPEDAVGDIVQVHLMDDNSSQAVAGEYILTPDKITFQPLIPLTRGLSYAVTVYGEVLASVKIPPVSGSGAPEVLEVYPTADSLPENLLKFYISFSRPMQEADPLSFIRLLCNGRDTVEDAFLDLRPALWNREGTLLTLWLDPGRIKRELQPNQSSGPPLKEGNSYELIIGRWRSKAGAPLNQTHQKKFFVRSRDATSPDPSLWKINFPKSGTRDTLAIGLGESLDYLLLRESIQLIAEKSTLVAGRIIPGREEAVVKFVPDAPWTPGRYLVRCESRLEDLAGNNLNRLFDRDLTRGSNAKDDAFYERAFSIDP